MRLWHEALISRLPRPQLLGQHRECCALRGNGWGKKHATVNYVFEYSPMMLVRYHGLIMKEMRDRTYQVDILWENPLYRGKSCEPWPDAELAALNEAAAYPEHDDAYLQECLDNLAGKGLFIAHQ
ncbi:TIGR02328 family protein [Paenibacillus chibensis]|uniref:TIGR02328 family protein n=1 Tax=Paenibacillus chibensis TaxID=59846 RepID=A0ABU6PYR5_9BACL|nr:TIGR02328 family protein [Paenibacillus chibensis]MEC0368403.1 TIGR02328 family protein [Paenibacillus chibensis]MED5020004.1 TIGR02328 family protein [Paenibacillus chibensis]